MTKLEPRRTAEKGKRKKLNKTFTRKHTWKRKRAQKLFVGKSKMERKNAERTNERSWWAKDSCDRRPRRQPTFWCSVPSTQYNSSSPLCGARATLATSRHAQTPVPFVRPYHRDIYNRRTTTEPKKKPQKFFTDRNWNRLNSFVFKLFLDGEGIRDYVINKKQNKKWGNTIPHYYTQQTQTHTYINSRTSRMLFSSWRRDQERG